MPLATQRLRSGWLTYELGFLLISDINHPLQQLIILDSCGMGFATVKLNTTSVSQGLAFEVPRKYHFETATRQACPQNGLPSPRTRSIQHTRTLR